MTHSALKGTSILVIEDQPLILMYVASAFEDAGAMVTVASDDDDARRLIERDEISAAIVEHGLASQGLYELLKLRAIPFVIFTGHDTRDCGCEWATVISKPASEETLLSAVEVALSRASAVTLPYAHQPGLLSVA